jgi:phosphoribosylanthranilate isomerase
MDKNIPYIGITGITTETQIDAILEMWKELQITQYQLMLGFLVSYNQVNNEPYTNPRYVKLGDLHDLLYASGEAFSVVHFNSRTPHFSDEVETIFNHYGLPDGIQLNISKPAPAQIRKILDLTPYMKIIYQVNNAIITHVKDYFHTFSSDDLTILTCCHYYLLDASGGRGKTYDKRLALDAAQYLSSFTRNLGVAGGIGPTNGIQAKQDFPRWSIDAESGLRTNNELDLEKVKQYLSCFI